MPIHDATGQNSHRPTRRALFAAAALPATVWWAGCASRTPSGGAPAGGEGGPPRGATGDWRRDWQALIEAARAEGRLSLLTWGNAWGGPGFAGFAGAVERFEKAFPGVAVDRLGESSPRVWMASIQQARSAGRYAFDLALMDPYPGGANRLDQQPAHKQRPDRREVLRRRGDRHAGPALLRAGPRVELPSQRRD